MTWWRRLLHRRLTLLHALAVALVFLVLGSAFYKILDARLVASDHELLHRHAQWVQRAAAMESGATDLQALQRRLDDLRLIQPELQLTLNDDVEMAAPSPGHGTAVADPPVRTIVREGAAFEVLDVELARPHLPATRVRLALPTQPRQQTLRRYRNTMLAASMAGVLASMALSALAMRWGVRSLRRLSSEARQVGAGGRISMMHVDGELTELVQAFNLTLAKLEQAYRQSESFSADVAHELRTPLATLIGGTQFVLSRPRTAAQFKDALISNLEELERLKTLVNDMLFLARADQGERAQSLERQDLGALADATIDYCAALLDEAGLTALRVGTASAVCNAPLIRRAMANLLSNAIQHASGARRIELHLQALPGKVSLWVFNSGTPLPPEIAAHIFDRFFQASEARSEHRAHHGLGLAIVQAVARMHGGSVFVRPQPEGNAIGFEIPGALASEQRRLRDPAHEPF